MTEPDLRTAARPARRFLTLLRATIVAIGRVRLRHGEGLAALDANVSVRRRGETALGTKAS